jgi:hypothetical protein
VNANFLGIYGKYVGQKCTWNGQLHHPTPSNNCLKKWQLRGNFEANLVHLLVKKGELERKRRYKKQGFSPGGNTDIACKMVIELFYELNI